MPGIVGSQRPLLAYRMALNQDTYMVLAYYEGDAKRAFEEAVGDTHGWNFSQMRGAEELHFRLQPYHRMHLEMQVTIVGSLQHIIFLLQPNIVYQIEPLPSVPERLPDPAVSPKAPPVPVWRHIKEDPFA